jgi:hypothetical protein
MASFSDFQVGELALPAVTTQPQSQRVNLGSPVTFTVAASGATPLSYQWRTNTVNISGATGVSYAIASAQDSHAGSYSCVVGNVNGSDLSSSAVLTINHPPSLTAIADQNVNEQTAMTVTASVSDADGGTITYALTTAPSGASISSSGVISWTPTEAQGPSTNTFTAQVSDDGSPALTDSKTFTVVVNEVNLAPTLAVPGTQTINELSTLTVTNTASDPDLPANTLTFSLVSPPGGMTIGSSSGVISWTPSSAQSPGTNTVTVRVTDNGSSPLSDTKSFTVIANHVPIAGTASFERPRDLSLKILISNLMTNATDSKAHALTLAGVGATSTNGATITSNGTYIFYPVPPGGDVTDRFSYTVSDGTTNTTGLVIITIKADSTGETQNIVSIASVPGGIKIIFAAIPGLPYLVQRTGSLSDPISWGTQTNVTADSGGRFEYVDLGPPSPSYYRSAKP